MTDHVVDPNGEVVVYESPDGAAIFDVTVGNGTVWLSQAQISELFERERSVITKHLNNVFREGEIERQSNVQEMHIASSDRPTTLYSLDVIISVGYRVKSKRGTQFRVWANQVLRDHLIRGYTLNEKRLLAIGVEFDQVVALLSSTLHRTEALTTEGSAVLDVIQHYARTWRMLEAYDEGRLPETPEQTSAPLATLDIESARHTIKAMRGNIISRGEEPGLFGQERSDVLEIRRANLWKA